jgi:hypothetical protein
LLAAGGATIMLRDLTKLPRRIELKSGGTQIAGSNFEEYQNVLEQQEN